MPTGFLNCLKNFFNRRWWNTFWFVMVRDEWVCLWASPSSSCYLASSRPVISSKYALQGGEGVRINSPICNSSQICEWIGLKQMWKMRSPSSSLGHWRRRFQTVLIPLSLYCDANRLIVRVPQKSRSRWLSISSRREDGKIVQGDECTESRWNANIILN